MCPLHPEDIAIPCPTCTDRSSGAVASPIEQARAHKGDAYVSVNATHAATPVGVPPQQRPSTFESVNPTR